jgi:hypothetical protein
MYAVSCWAGNCATIAAESSTPLYGYAHEVGKDLNGWLNYGGFEELWPKQVIPLSNPFVEVGFRHPSSMTKSSPKPREPVAGTHIYGVLMSD